MSYHGWSGEGLGEEAEEGLSGWAPPLDTETPPPAEIREDEDEEHAGRSVEDDASGRAPTGGGSIEGSERGTPRRTEPRVEGDEARRDGGTLRSEPLSPRARRMAESVLDTPRGREMFNQFLARLARQPAPSEEPASARTTTGETAEAVTSTPRARQRDAFSFDASRPSLPLVGETQGEVQTVTSAGAALNARGTTRLTPPRAAERLDVARTPYSEGGTPGRQGETPARVAETPTRRAGTPTPDSALQEMLVDTFSRALQRLSASAGTPKRTPRPTGVRPMPRPVSTSTGNALVGQTRPARAPMLGYQGSTAPRVALPAPASTPVGTPMAAIPSYGGVTIQAPSTSWNEGRDGTARLGALYPPFQPPITPTAGWSSGGTLPAWSAAPATQTPASVGGLGLGRSFSGQGGGYPTHSAYPQRPMVSRTLGHSGDYAAREIGTQPRRNEPIVGIPTALRNAVKVIVPFYSETAMSERAAAFWRSFEKCTHGMDDQMRLTAFEQCLKGKIGQEWWYNSRIESFEALRVRFHNRFICQTPAQLWSRLKTAKRNRGESAEEWGDRISTMCEALNYHEPRMRYEFFLDGLRNKQMKTVLNASMVASIPEACALLLYKNLHLPVEEEGEFAGEVAGQLRANGAASTETQVLQELRQMNQLMRTQQLGPETPRGRVSAVAPPTPPHDGVPVVSRNATGSAFGPLRIRLGPDTRTTEGEVVCGRCGRIGCSRETCPRGQGRCNRCNELGHYSMECNRPKPQGNYRNGERRRLECFLCGGGDHMVAKCPSLERLRGAVRNATVGTSTGVSQQ